MTFDDMMTKVMKKLTRLLAHLIPPHPLHFTSFQDHSLKILHLTSLRIIGMIPSKVLYFTFFHDPVNCVRHNDDNAAATESAIVILQVKIFSCANKKSPYVRIGYFLVLLFQILSPAFNISCNTLCWSVGTPI